MKVLIVDDNKYVVEGLKRQIDWSSYGIDELFGCYNVPDAEQILENNAIDFVISDIEMPEKSGFDLLEWIRRRDSEIEVVLLTSYADFDYAQKSVNYKVSRYLLKPLDTEELENVVRDLVQQYHIRNKKKQLIEYGNHWISQQSAAKTAFWSSLLGRMQQTGQAQWTYPGSGVRPPYASNEKLLPVLIFLDTGAEVWQDEMLCFLCNNALGELSEAKKLNFESVYQIQSGQFIAVFYADAGHAPRVTQLIQDFVDLVRTYFLFNVSYHAFEPCGASQLENVLRDIGRLCEDHAVQDTSRFMEASDTDQLKMDYQPPDTDAWKRMIQLGSMERFQESLGAYFKAQQGKGSLSPDFLGALLVDWNLLVSELCRETIGYRSVSQLRDYKFSYWLTQDAAELQELMLDEANRLSQLIHSPDDSETTVAKIKTYIRDHLDEVTRGQLAEQFYLSPSYLSKLFCRETGEPLIKYIQKERIKLAKELLIYSEYSISDIAAQTGYPNFSHFSKQFRKFVGCTPNEFRKNNKKPKQAER